MTVAQDIQQHIGILAADPTTKQQEKVYTDALAQFQNAIKGFGERQAQMLGQSGEEKTEAIPYRDAPESIRRQMEAREGFQPASEPITDPKTLKAQHSIATKQAVFELKQRQTQIAFELEQARETMRAMHTLTAEQQAEKQRIAFDSIDRALEIINAAKEPPQVDAEE